MAELIPGVRNSARALILREDHILLLQKEDDVYALPGGGQETGEPLEAALQRECREEIGTDVLAPALIQVCDYFKLKRTEPATRRHQVDFIFRCAVPDDYAPHNGPSPDKRQLEVRWVEVRDLVRLAFSPAYLVLQLPRLIESRERTAEPLYTGVFHDQSNP
ncbi:NUDIX domain-containing protein [Halomonas eurihalina]|uniref:NUDIX domain-containing protein n=1 Tax=Halomonas eurihalina TaxID=42566 RepID=A0A5D9CWH8_HALER|nr:NUDIX domain-containing protein [Halomonas eurihalina]MDR5860895.1 NUDIX domain-containing protein [Halomonas eurihalina]TZG35879.1 NUDIX domain-containing protein [Halomonas eurihalina]